MMIGMNSMWIIWCNVQTDVGLYCCECVIMIVWCIVVCVGEYGANWCAMCNMTVDDTHLILFILCNTLYTTICDTLLYGYTYYIDTHTVWIFILYVMTILYMITIMCYTCVFSIIPYQTVSFYYHTIHIPISYPLFFLSNPPFLPLPFPFPSPSTTADNAAISSAATAPPTASSSPPTPHQQNTVYVRCATRWSSRIY